MADRTPTRSQRSGSAKPYERPSPSVSTPKHDQWKGEQQKQGDTPGGLLRSVFQAIASPFRSTPKRRTILPSSSSPSRRIDLDSGSQQDPSSESQRSPEKTRFKSFDSPRRDSKRTSPDMKRPGRFSAAHAMETDSESEQEHEGEQEKSAERPGEDDDDVEMLSPPKAKAGPPQRSPNTSTSRNLKRTRGSSLPQNGPSKFWQIVTDPSAVISFEEYITLVTDFKNSRKGEGKGLSEVEMEALKELHERVQGGGGGRSGYGRAGSPALGISTSGRGLFGSPIGHKASDLSRSRSTHFGSNGLPSPSLSSFNTPTRPNVTSISTIPFPTKSTTTDLPSTNSPTSGSTPASPATLFGRKILGTPRRLAEMRTYAGPGRSSLSGSVSSPRLSEIAGSGSASANQGSGLNKSVSGRTGGDVDMDGGSNALNASTSDSNNASKSSEQPKRTQAATELLSMIKSANAESSHKVLPQAIVNPYEGGCFNIGSSQAQPGSSTSSTSTSNTNATNPKKKRARLSLKAQHKEEEVEQAEQERRPSGREVEVDGTGAGVEARTKGRMTDMELIEEADRVQKRSRPNPPADLSPPTKQDSAPAPIPKSTFSFNRPISRDAQSDIPATTPKPQPIPSQALFGNPSSSTSLAELLPTSTAFVPTNRTQVEFGTTSLPSFSFGKTTGFGTEEPKTTTTATSEVERKISVKNDIAGLDRAALPITTFVALAQCPDLSDRFAFSVKQQVRGIDISDLPQFVFDSLVGLDSADLSSSLGGGDVIKPEAPKGFTGWGAGAFAAAKSAKPQWDCFCGCKWDMDLEKCKSCEGPRP